MKLGINSYTFMWSIGFKGANPAFPNHEARPSHPLTALDLLDKACQLGVRLVQSGPNLPLDQLTGADLDAFIQKAQDASIELELGTRGLDYDHLVKQVALAKRMGAKLIRTLPEINGQFISDTTQLPAIIEKIRPVLEKEDLKLALENGRTPAADLRAALDQINSPHVGIVLDMVNSLAVPEGWKEVTRLLAPHTMCLHYKDFTMTRAWHMMGFICQGTPAGQGMVDTRWLLDTLKVSHYDYNLIIELWPPEQESVDATAALEQAWAEQSVTYLRQFIQD